LRIQPGAFGDLADQTIEPFLSKKIGDFLKTGSRLRKIGDGLLNGGLTVGLLLFAERVLKMGSQDAEDRLHLLFRPLDTRQELSEIEEAMEVLGATSVIWILNRLKNGLEEIHDRTCFCKAAGNR
jgi:hypothetical protein